MMLQAGLDYVLGAWYLDPPEIQGYRCPCCSWAGYSADVMSSLATQTWLCILRLRRPSRASVERTCGLSFWDTGSRSPIGYNRTSQHFPALSVVLNCTVTSCSYDPRLGSCLGGCCVACFGVGALAFVWSSRAIGSLQRLAFGALGSYPRAMCLKVGTPWSPNVRPWRSK